jgi:hypothetical protein
MPSRWETAYITSDDDLGEPANKQNSKDLATKLS